MKSLFVAVGLLLLAQSFNACKHEDDTVPPLDTTDAPADSATHAKLRGGWCVDSAMDPQTGMVLSHLMDTVYGLNPNTSNRIVAYLKTNDTFAVPAGYHWGIVGTYHVQSMTKIDFLVELDPDRAGRPHRVWDSVVASVFKKAETYRIEGDGQAGTQLFLGNAAKQTILRCTKR